LNLVESALRRASTDLDDLGLSWALIGGLAVAAVAEPRFTRDVDIVVAVDGDRAAEAAVHGLGERDYGIGSTVEHDTTERLATVRLTSPTGDGTVLVDLLFASSGIEADIVAAATSLAVLPGLRLPVATIGHLIALKLLASDDRLRPQDADDLVHLRAVANPAELARAREAVELITTRGYHRGRDLTGALAALG